MQSTSHDFIARAQKGLVDNDLQDALARFRTGFSVKRSEAAARLPEFEALRDKAVEIKNHTLEHLDFYLEQFADKVEEAYEECEGKWGKGNCSITETYGGDSNSLVKMY